MIIVNIRGGLGNQMFGFALYRALLKLHKEAYVDFSCKSLYENNKDACASFSIEPDIAIFDPEYVKADERIANRYLQDRLNRNIWKRWEYRILKKRCRYYEEKIPGVFDKNVFKFDDVYLNGYWQSEKYFRDIAEEIRHIYRFPDIFNDYQRRMLEKIQQTHSVAVHVRRGDYLLNPEIYGMVTLQYYNDAMKYIRERRQNAHFYFFSDDIGWVQAHFEGDDITMIEASDAMGTGNLDMALMSYCNDNIIANSTFSWWGAWLNTNSGKIVISPKVWAGNSTMRDIWCKDWIKI